MELKQLKKELKSLETTAPFACEGRISPLQIYKMSTRQKKQWEKNKARRYEVIDRINYLELSEGEKQKIKIDRRKKEIESMILQNNSQIDFLKDFKQVKSNRMNKIKKKYLQYIKENEILNEQLQSF